MPIHSIEEFVESSNRRCNAIPDWLDACQDVYPSPLDSAFQKTALTARAQKQMPIWNKKSSPCTPSPQQFIPSSRTAPPSIMDDAGRQSGRGRRSNRGVVTRSRRKNAAEAVSLEESIARSAQTVEGTVSPDQRQFHESMSAVSPELDLGSSAAFSQPFIASSATRSSVHSRSLSPTKRTSDLSAAKPPIEVGAEIEVPQAVKGLVKKIANICDGLDSLKSELENIDDRDYPGIFFDDPDTPSVPHDLEVLQKLRSFRDAAAGCSEREKPEPSWAEEVLYPLLKLAAELENRDNVQRVQVENVTATPISPKSLMPTGLQHLSFSSKRVDYCIYLSQTKAQEYHTRDNLTLRNFDIHDEGINQAGSSNYVKWLPQLLAVECKNSLPGIEGAVQLGIWMASLRTRLERLMDQTMIPKEHLKPMPCLKTVGFYWHMYWCFVGDNGETVLYGPQDLGSTRNMKGMYQILKALQEIVRYGRDEYWPWFKKTMLWEAN
ncbi:hypothetical protein AJ79_09121 [Helicocarpus griseus UAMH5409]|uniref:PD-(D/E)XK nuclease-like domain-containing protein n=1 Tax=Helicocarpus griseus UAMH5409 TaxID=1447875 RepID=A0A2B7WM13_9EURO|nr:hypothetical protein AJ79_09121 [Helicocarpus griseus UAMH5409]